MIETSANPTDRRLDELLAECLCRADELAGAIDRGDAVPSRLARLEELIGLLTGPAPRYSAARPE